MKTISAIFATALATSPAAALDLPLPVTDDMYAQVDQAMVDVGRLLFWDPVLSGNRNIACATCHHPRFGTSDGVSLSLGEGASGLGPARVPDPAEPPTIKGPPRSPAAQRRRVAARSGASHVAPGNRRSRIGCTPLPPQPLPGAGAPAGGGTRQLASASADARRASSSAPFAGRSRAGRALRQAPSSAGTARRNGSPGRAAGGTMMSTRRPACPSTVASVSSPT